MEFWYILYTNTTFC